jgi:hypothetical protein
MAEVSVWSKASANEEEDTTTLLKRVHSALLKRWSKERTNASITQEQENDGKVVRMLEELVQLLEKGPEADKQASDFGRLGGHTLLLSVLESPEDEEEGELAARAVDLCMELCERFPMKGGSITACEEDTLRTSVPVTSAFAKIDPVTLHMRRRMQDGAMDTDSRPAREIRCHDTVTSYDACTFVCVLTFR